MKTTAIILAGGKGSRLQALTQDKTLLRIGAGAVISWSVRVFCDTDCCDALVITYRDEDQRVKIEKELKQSIPNLPLIHWVQGGEQRQDSVFNALNAVPEDTDIVYIHDGARPFITAKDLGALKDAVMQTGSAALATPVTDTIKRADKKGETEGLRLEDLDRSRLYAMQTPQVFDFQKIRNAYQKVKESGIVVTDDVEALSQSDGTPCTLVFPEQNNLKITRPEDVELANFMIQTASVKKVFELDCS